MNYCISLPQARGIPPLNAIDKETPELQDQEENLIYNYEETSDLVSNNIIDLLEDVGAMSEAFFISDRDLVCVSGMTYEAAKSSFFSIMHN